MEVSESSGFTPSSSSCTMSRAFVIVSILFAASGIGLWCCNQLMIDQLPFFCTLFVILPLCVSAFLTFVRHLRGGVQRLFVYGFAVVGVGVIGAYWTILWQEDKYVACVLRTYRGGGDYQSLVKEKSFFVSDHVKTFVCWYIHELEMIDAFLTRIDEANKMSAGDLRDAQFRKIEDDLLWSKRRMTSRFEHLDVDGRYSTTARDSLTSIYRNIEDLCQRKRVVL